MAPKHLLKDMTWIEFRERLADRPTILIPLGSQEEQGPMAPMGDWMLTEAIAGRIAQRAGAIAAPTLPFGYADYFRPIPGGIALRPETFKSVLEDICVNFLDHGLDHLVVFNGHSGNFPLIDQTIRKIKEKWREFHPELGQGAFGHGGDPLTSVYLHHFPELMRMDLIELEAEKGEMLGLPTAGLNAVRFKDVDINLAVDITDRCTNGIAGGDPTRSSAAIGEKITDYITDYTVAFLEHFKDAETRTT
jgi:creatinine amidohydrolase